MASVFPEKDGQIKAVYRFLGPLRADLLRKSVERLYSFDVLLGGARKVRGGTCVSDTRPPATAPTSVKYQGVNGFSRGSGSHGFFLVCGTLSTDFRISKIASREGSQISRLNRFSEHVRGSVPLVGEIAQKL